MNSRFPEIAHIDDLRPYIREDAGIRVYDRQDHIQVNYNFVGAETFKNPFDLECRGIVFDKGSGAIIARPFQKFFNVGEREQLHEIDFASPHRVEHKLDGSMVFGLSVGEVVRFFTRGGPSSQSAEAWRRASENERSFVADAVGQGVTPIFEWTAPDNRIVVHYPENALTLLALREMVSGRYLSRSEMQAMARPHLVRVVDEIGEGGDTAEWRKIVETIRAMRGVEGAVIAFDDGHRLKIKADDYVIRHRATSGVSEEKAVVRALLEGAIDDVLPLLSDDVRSSLEDWRGRFEAKLREEAGAVDAYCAGITGLEPKERALRIKADLARAHQPIAFQILKSQAGLECLRDYVAKNISTRAKMDEMATAFGLPRWVLGVDLDG